MNPKTRRHAEQNPNTKSPRVGAPEPGDLGEQEEEGETTELDNLCSFLEEEYPDEFMRGNTPRPT